MFEICTRCGEDFLPKRRGQRTCSLGCYRILYRQENAEARARRDKARRERIKNRLNAEARARYRDDPLYREEIRQKNKAKALARRAKFKSMGLNAHGQPFGKRGPKPKAHKIRGHQQNGSEE